MPVKESFQVEVGSKVQSADIFECCTVKFVTVLQCTVLTAMQL